MNAIPMFVALDPDDQLADAIWRYKRQVQTLVGEQLYLSDPPHLTVYLSVFDDQQQVVEAVEACAGQLPRPSCSIVGWHVFESDPLNGNHTLVLQMDSASQQTLRGLQSQLMARLAGLRNVDASTARFEARRSALSNVQQDSVAAVGFPYTSDDWHPHFTVASVRPADWESVAEALLPNAPRMLATCPRLKVYRLVEETPEVVEAFTLS